MITILIFLAGMFAGFFVGRYKRTVRVDELHKIYKEQYAKSNGLYEAVKRT